MSSPLPAATDRAPDRSAALRSLPALLPALESAWPALCALAAVFSLWLWAGSIGHVNPRDGQSQLTCFLIQLKCDPIAPARTLTGKPRSDFVIHAGSQPPDPTVCQCFSCYFPFRKDERLGGCGIPTRDSRVAVQTDKNRWHGIDKNLRLLMSHLQAFLLGPQPGSDFCDQMSYDQECDAPSNHH